MRRVSLLGVVATVVLSMIASPVAAQTKYSLKKGQVVTVSGNELCGLIKNKWTPVKKSGKKKYVVDSKNKRRCKTLLAPTSLKKSGLSQIPSASGLLKASASAAAFAVSGTAPALKDIPTLGAKNVFWNPGFIDALVGSTTPTQAQCDEFFVGQNDGQSAGMLGCYSVQGVGYSFQSILEGAASTCYMKGIPTKENLATGGVSVVEGSLPDGDITKLFSTPEGSKDRLIKAVISSFGGQGGQTGFINIHSSKKLASKGNQYAYSVWFCNDGQATASNYEEASVTLDGQFKFFNVNVMGTNEYQNEITGYLTKTGATVEFDTSKERTASSYGEFQGNNFKAFVTVSPNNTIATKMRESFSGFGRSNYTVASFSGSSLSDFRVQSAAIKDVFSIMSKQAGLEYRNSVYVSAPTAAIIAELAKVDIATDTFYSEGATVTPDFSDKSCTAEPEVAISMNFSSPTLQQVFMACAAERINNMDFCRVPEIFQSQSKCQPN